MNAQTLLLAAALCVEAGIAGEPQPARGGESFQGRFYSGRGDGEYLELLDIARRMFAPDPEFQHLAMLYMPSWNGLVEGPTWDAWWIQNSYGTTYAALPFLQEPFLTWLQNSQDLWFDQMGDGKTERPFSRFKWVPPDGALCDAARPGLFIAKQGDGRVDLHDWGMEFTAAGLLLQSELLLIARDPDAIARYLPKLERSAAFVESRRDPTNNLFLAGPAGNLLAPSYAGWKKPDGTYGMAYLAGLSITYIAALDRLLEVEKLAGRERQAELYRERREQAREGLARLRTEAGYFIRSLDPDGTRHGVYGAAKHGYFEASPNHDAICFRVADDELARRIFAQIQAIPQLRPHDFVLPNYPSYDDLYEKPQGLWAFGTWVNGGHWSTCEARMIMGYYRLERFEDARKSMRQLLKFARRFRMDNPLTQQGNEVYQPNLPVNLTYDAFGPPAAMVRGLFEYLYGAEALTLIPHIPPGISRMEQRFPVRFGRKQLYLATVGTGEITGVWLDGERWGRHDRTRVTLPYEKLAPSTRVLVACGGATPEPAMLRAGPVAPDRRERARSLAGVEELGAAREWLEKFASACAQAGIRDEPSVAHARTALECIQTLADRRALQAQAKLPGLPAVSQQAADKLYLDTVNRLYEGLRKVVASYASAADSAKRKVHDIAQKL